MTKEAVSPHSINTTHKFPFFDSVLMPDFSDLILFEAHGAFLNTDAKAEDAEDSLYAPCAKKTEEALG